MTSCSRICWLPLSSRFSARMSIDVFIWNETFLSVFLQHVYMPQATLSTAVQPPMSVRSPRGDASRARPAASWSVWLWACWGRVREKVSYLYFSVNCATCSISKPIRHLCFLRLTEASADNINNLQYSILHHVPLCWICKWAARLIYDTQKYCFRG